MVSIIVGGLVIACSIYLGWGIGNYYKKRVSFYKDLNDFLNYAISNINFLKDSVDTILLNFIDNNKPNQALIDIMHSYINKKTEVNTYLVKKEENPLINNIFNHLGQSDSENQIVGLKNYSSQIISLISKCEEDYNRVGKISTKLGGLFGLTLAICFI